jgi:hypothetical protein
MRGCFPVLPQLVHRLPAKADGQPASRRISSAMLQVLVNPASTALMEDGSMPPIRRA